MLGIVGYTKPIEQSQVDGHAELQRFQQRKANLQTDVMSLIEGALENATSE